jgi:hypothetical protein
MSIEDLMMRWTWRPIPRCPGRFVLQQGDAQHSPVNLVGPDVQCVEYRIDTARDPVVIARLENGGLISYRRRDGTYCHTLNTVEGFRRKLAQLGIESCDAGA